VNLFPKAAALAVWRCLAIAVLMPIATPALAAPAGSGEATLNFNAIKAYSADSEGDQVTTIGQFSDLRPDDWAYQALQKLVELYGCVAGYPDGTIRGNRAISR
jgi:hypothetical protein